MPSKNNSFIVKGKFPDYLSPRLRPVYNNQIVKAMVEQCGGNLFFEEDIPVSLEIEIMTVTRLSVQTKLNQRNHTGFPKVSSVLVQVTEALKGALYVKESQIAEVFISKIHGNENRIKITVYRA